MVKWVVTSRKLTMTKSPKFLLVFLDSLPIWLLTFLGAPIKAKKNLG